jgi:hypothetical protein
LRAARSPSAGRLAALPLAGAFAALLFGCGAGSKPPPAEPKGIHSPPLAQLTSQQLRALSMQCQQYTPDQSMRGPYDAGYCEKAIAAWSDAPLQLIQIEKPAAGAPASSP